MPAARRTAGTVHAFDIEAALVRRLDEAARAAGLRNVSAAVRDLLAEGTGLES